MTECRRKAVLIVEDEEDVATLLEDRLEQAGYATHTEERGKAALTYAADHRPDLVILDLMLPDLDGYEVCRQLRTLYHAWAVPVLMLTAKDKPVDQLRGFAHGADAYMTKPYEGTELLETIALLLRDTGPGWVDTGFTSE
jgi:DNA-binding response OmpR family regulator